MVARLRGRPSPPSSSENQEPEVVQPKAKRSPQALLVGLTAVSLIAAASTGGALWYYTLGPGKAQTVNHAELKTAKTGALVDLGPFVVNLGNINDRRYLRMALSIDFQTRDPEFTEANSLERTSWIGEFKNELKTKEAAFKDVVVTTLSAKNPQSLGTPMGKEELKADLIAKLNLQLDDSETSVFDVYFTDFVIQ